MKKALLLPALVLTFLAFGCGGRATPDSPTPQPAPSGVNAGGPKGAAVAVLKPRSSLDTGLEQAIVSLAVSADGKVLVTQATGKGKTVQLWDLEKKQLLHAFENPSPAVLPVVLSRDGKTAVYVSPDTVSVRFIDVASGKESPRLKRKEGGLNFFNLTGLALSPKGDLAVAASAEALVGWDTRTGEQRFAWKGDKLVKALSDFFDGGKRIASGYKGQNDQVKVWDVAAGKSVQALAGEDDNQAHALAVSPDGKRLAACYTIGPAQVWDLGSGKRLSRSDLSPGLRTNVAFLPDNRTIAFAGQPFGETAMKINLVNTDTGKTTHLLEGHSDEVTAVAVSADGGTLVSAGRDRTIKIWDLKAAR